MPLYTVCLGGKTRGRTTTSRCFKKVQKKTRKFKKGNSLTIQLPNQKDKNRTLKSTQKSQEQIRKISLKKKREFLTKKGMMRNGNATPEKVIDTLMYAVINAK
tara:strand:+ start:1252 stop:1560 length:309 start_codon:yes stop_codon:yes gene_type:complete